MMFRNVEKVKETFIGRVKNSQVFIDNYADATTKKVAERTIDNFTNGIKNDVFGLQRLKPKTIEQKKRKGHGRVLISTMIIQTHHTEYS